MHRLVLLGFVVLSLAMPILADDSEEKTVRERLKAMEEENTKLKESIEKLEKRLEKADWKDQIEELEESLTEKLTEEVRKLEESQPRILIHEKFKGWLYEGEEGEVKDISEMTTKFSIEKKSNVLVLLYYHAHETHTSLQWILEKKSMWGTFREVKKGTIAHENRNGSEEFVHSKTHVELFDNLASGKYRLRWQVTLHHDGHSADAHSDYDRHLTLVQFPVEE